MSGHSSDEGAEDTVASSTTVGAAKRRGVHSSLTVEKKTGMFVSRVCVCVCVCLCVHAYMHM